MVDATAASGDDSTNRDTVIIGTGGSLDVKDRLGRRTLDIAYVYVRIENHQIVTEDTEDPLSEVRHGRSRR